MTGPLPVPSTKSDTCTCYLEALCFARQYNRSSCIVYRISSRDYIVYSVKPMMVVYIYISGHLSVSATNQPAVIFTSCGTDRQNARRTDVDGRQMNKNSLTTSQTERRQRVRQTDTHTDRQRSISWRCHIALDTRNTLSTRTVNTYTVSYCRAVSHMSAKRR
jgi:hypothetical protein